MTMFVVKRDGRREPVQFDKITTRLEALTFGLDTEWVDATCVAQKVISGLHDGITTVEVDQLASETAAYLSTQHPDYSMLAARVAISALHKVTRPTFSATMTLLYTHIMDTTGEPTPLLADDVYQIIMDHAQTLDEAIQYDRDFSFDFFGFKTLERSYLTKVNGVIAERPQDMIMRVSIGIHKHDIAAALETYELMSGKWFTHATPTLFNAGTPRPQCSSCFLVAMKDDSIEGIYDTLKETAMISKNSGGIGLHIHNIRASNSYIRGTNGSSNGLVPMLRVFSDSARYVTQGGGKRKGSIAVYLEPWHADIFEWLDLKKNHGNELQRARDLFFGLWIPDLFMERVKSNGNWSLFCPNEAPGLADVYGAEYVQLYERYEAEGRQRRTIPAQQLWFAILEAQVETGTPYLLHKDACNEKSNQKNLGTIKSSNLCTEIIQYSDANETAVCNLASIALPNFVRDDGTFDFEHLYYVSKVVTRNLNKVIDINFYPVETTRRSNFRHRPVGIGVQGLADCFIRMRYPFDSPQAKQLNIDIFETLYFGAMEASMELARQHGPYETYEGSPVSQGIFQFDMWGVTPTDRWDWEGLKADVAEHGVRNSLLIAPMPTASTAQILGNNESVEPFTSNIYNRRVLSGEFAVVNKWLIQDLISHGLWTPAIRNQIIAEGGSIQGVTIIPQELKNLYKTVWEIKQKVIIDLAADRSPYIDQSQSLNLHVAAPTFGKLSSMHFYAWSRGLKTGMYYMRSQPKANPIQFTVDQSSLAQAVSNKTTTTTTSNNNAGAAAAEAANDSENQTPQQANVAVASNHKSAKQPLRQAAQWDGHVPELRTPAPETEEEDGPCLTCSA